MSKSVLIWVGVMLAPFLLLGCNTEQVIEDAGRSSPVDSCPDDPNKTAPGVCGCGTADADSDGDGVEDCHDACPDDPNKTAPGVCGCDEPETDRDGDSRPDCIDTCPDDPAKTAPGVCGCGVPETCNALTLLVRPVDEIVVLSDLTVWDVGGFAGVTTAIRWLADDPIEDFASPTDSDAEFGLRNLRTHDAVGADFIGVGSGVIIIGFEEQDVGQRLITFDDGSTWGVRRFSDENESRTWRVGEAVVIYESNLSHEALNLRTGRVIALDPNPQIFDSLVPEFELPPEPEPPPTFVSGDVFSFLTAGQTAVFLSRVGTLNRAIEAAIEAALSATLADLAARGFGGSGMSVAAVCQAMGDEIVAKHEGTWVALQYVADFFGVFFALTPSEVQEIEDFNCREYPNLGQIGPSCVVIVVPC